jgi:hypothetical protein
MAQYKQSVVRVSRVGMRDVRNVPQQLKGPPHYEIGRQAIDKHMEPLVSDGWHVAGYHVVLDTEHNVEEHHFIWRKD